MILEVDGLEFGYNSAPIIRDLNFAVEEGEVLSILGPNGAGKTTLLKCLNHILRPRGGTVLIDGIDTRKLGGMHIARKIGYVPQGGEDSRMKVYDLILLGRKPHFTWGPKEADLLITDEMIGLLGLKKLSFRYADELSGGEFRLVQIARALAQEPRIVLLDEPSNGLDISNQYHLMEKIRTLIHREPRSAIMTMHDINLALRFSDKFLLLKKGIIHSFGGREIINPKNIKEVYAIEVRVEEVAGIPLVIPL